VVTINLTGFDNSIPKTIKLEARTYKEALEGLKLFDFFNPIKQTKRFICEVSECNEAQKFTSDIKNGVMTLVCNETVKQKQLRGAGNRNVRFVIGVILIVTAVILTSGMALAEIPWYMTVMFNVGVSLVLGAIIELITEPGSGDANKRQSRSARTYPNTVESGTPIALIFGTHRFGGHIFSVNIESANGSDVYFSKFAENLWVNIDPNRRDSWDMVYRNADTKETGLQEWEGYLRTQIGGYQIP